MGRFGKRYGHRKGGSLPPKKGDSPEKTFFPEPTDRPAEDIETVISYYRLPREFPEEVLTEAAELKNCRVQKGDRLDLRKTYIFTCDPVTARDYDDALSIRKVGKKLILGVHIADVSHYVRPHSAIDREAAKRSTSIYFPGKVIPMLPKELSNGLCSLVPGEDRLAFSVFMTFDAEGKMVARSFAKSIIRSRDRLTYEQVMSIISGGAPEGVSKTALRTIRQISDLAQKLRKIRFEDGALDLDIPEAEVMLDPYGEMQGLNLRTSDESHQMIEECMVAANEAVAKELWTKGVRILARLHEPADPEKIQFLREELRGMGVKVGAIENPNVFRVFLQSIKSHPLYSHIAVSILRSMKKAVYSPDTIGHAGLAKRYYAHFTSPIRRYPDLTLHRQLADFLIKPLKARRTPAQLAAWAEHANEMEERATEAERALVEIKKYRLLEAGMVSRAGNEYSAVVTSCTPFGCFVEIPEIAVSGLIHISHLANDFVRYNESDHTLSASHGRSWKVGDPIRVKVETIDYRQRRVDFLPISEVTDKFHRKGRKYGTR